MDYKQLYNEYKKKHGFIRWGDWVEIETRSRDLLYIASSFIGVEATLINNNFDLHLNKYGGADLYIVTDDFKLIFIDVKPRFDNFRRQYYFETATIYPNEKTNYPNEILETKEKYLKKTRFPDGNKFDSWSLHPAITDKHFIAFTDNYRVTYFDKKKVNDLIKDIRKKNPDAFKYSPDKDYEGKICDKEFILIGFNQNLEYLKQLQPIVCDFILPDEVTEGIFIPNPLLDNKKLTHTDLIPRRRNNLDIQKFDKLVNDLSKAIYKKNEKEAQCCLDKMLASEYASAIEKESILTEDWIKDFIVKA